LDHVIYERSIWLFGCRKLLQADQVFPTRRKTLPHQSSNVGKGTRLARAGLFSHDQPKVEAGYVN